MKTDLVQANTAITAVPIDEAEDETTGLSSPQVAALDALLSGKTATDAAAAAGITRRTVYNWLHRDYRFQAAMNRRRREFQQTVAHRVGQIAADAAECVAGAVRNGDVKIALEILKRTGALAPPEIGSDDEFILRIEERERIDQREMRILASLEQERVLSQMKQLPQER